MGNYNILTTADMGAPSEPDPTDPLEIQRLKVEREIEQIEVDLAAPAAKRARLKALQQERDAIPEMLEVRQRELSKAAAEHDARQRDLNASAQEAVAAVIEAGHAALDHWYDYTRAFRAATDLGAETPMRIRAKEVIGNVSDLRAMLNRYANLT